LPKETELMNGDKRFLALASANIIAVLVVYALLRADISSIKATLGNGPAASSDFLPHLEELEAAVATKSDWPKIAPDAKQLREKYEAVASDAPLAMPPDLGKRLRALRWNIEALSYLAADELKNVDSTSFDEAESLCRDLLASFPENANTGIKDVLAAALAAASKEAMIAKRDLAIKSARAAVATVAQKQLGTQDPAKQADAYHDLELAFNAIEPFKEEPGAKKLRQADRT
jgi:hypothetical protein